MYLEKVEIAGFKSFAKKTTLEFSPGISAIVGPNGSGKSNIADAIRWVLGEQSMKMLRGKKSDDVIFAGTSEKARLGLAEVSLYLNNSSRKISLDFQNIVITRRVYRSGEGEYLINKSKVRLLDVQDILAQAGFGQKTYSVIGQGVIETLLKASPKEFREIFYDACGVRQYQIKKHISQNKLEATKQNIDRGQDLMREIEPRLRSLKRLVKKAEKKVELQKEKDAIFDKYYNHTLTVIQEKKDGIEADIDRYKENEKDILQEIAGFEQTLEEFEKKTTTLQVQEQSSDQLRVYKQDRDKKNEELYLIKGKISLEKERQSEGQLEQRKSEQEKLTFEVNNIKGRLSKAQTAYQEAQQKVKSKIVLQEEVNASILKIKTLIGTYQVKVNEKKVNFDEIETAVSNIFEAGKNIRHKIEKCQSLDELKKLGQDLAKQENELQALLVKIKNRQKKGQSQSMLTDLQTQLSEAFEKRGRSSSDINEVKIKEAVLKTEVQNLEKELFNTQNELKVADQALQKIKQQPQDKNSNLENYLATEIKLESEIKEIEKKIVVLEAEEAKRRQDELDERQKVFVVEKSYRRAQEELNQIRNKIHEVEISKASLTQEEALLLDEIGDDIGQQKLESLLNLYKTKPQKIEETQAREYAIHLKDLRRRLLTLGEVDPTTLEEYKETSERFTFLESQREDLAKASLKLGKIISKLDENIEKQFNRSFDIINQKFQKYFETLFGGGKAKLKREEVYTRVESIEEDPESENEATGGRKELIIEVKANPPGKKLRDLSMLSGGERALTSIALLMAIIESNPPPFIVLDEVDAALDEANSRRFAKIILEASHKSQILAITHNRATMGEAGILYGVTMQESGISKILSIKLEEAEKIENKKVQKH
ncbi:AAA family ATPase [Patescibacteria group bacterium]|nr:AAA family ATPase [Patescibacteria group bacterium]